MTRFLLVALVSALPMVCRAQAEEAAANRDLIEVRVSFVEFPAKVIARESVVAKTGVLPHAVVTALWVAGEGELLHTMSITTRNGLAAEIKQVEEIIYPTEFEVVPATNPKDKEGTRALPLIRPSNLETREVGYVLNVTPTLAGDSNRIAVTISCEHSRLVEWNDVGPDIDGSGFGTIEAVIEQPIFASFNTTTTVLLEEGESFVLGGAPTKDEDHAVYMILSASPI